MAITEPTKRLAAASLLLAMTLAATGCAGHMGRKGTGVFEVKDIAESACIYGFPMIGN